MVWDNALGELIKQNKNIMSLGLKKKQNQARTN